MIRVLLCDDHDLMRSMVREFLAEETDMTVIGEVSSLDELFAALHDGAPDVLLLDRILHGENTLNSIVEALAAAPGSRILMFSGDDDPAYCVRALTLGASGYLLKESAEQLPEAIRLVRGGSIYLDARVRDKVEARMRPAAGRGESSRNASVTPEHTGAARFTAGAPRTSSLLQRSQAASMPRRVIS